jgi:hypothetical protein
MLPLQQLVHRLKAKFAISLKQTWVQECVLFLKDTQSQLFETGHEDELLNAVFGQFLMSDLHVSGEGSLPQAVQVTLQSLLLSKGRYHAFLRSLVGHA